MNYTNTPGSARSWKQLLSAIKEGFKLRKGARSPRPNRPTETFRWDTFLRGLPVAGGRALAGRLSGRLGIMLRGKANEASANLKIVSAAIGEPASVVKSESQELANGNVSGRALNWSFFCAASAAVAAVNVLSATVLFVANEQFTSVRMHWEVNAIMFGSLSAILLSLAAVTRTPERPLAAARLQLMGRALAVVGALSLAVLAMNPGA